MISVCILSLTILSYGMLLVAGQPTVSNGGESEWGSCESVMRRLEEHDRNLKSFHQNFLSLFDEKLEVLTRKINNGQRTSQDTFDLNAVVFDCSDIKANGYTDNGVYRVYVDHQHKRHYKDAYCDMTTANGHWLVFQRRKDGSEDFYRTWSEYANGFGNISGEFWLGNDFLYLLTSKRKYRLRIDLEDFDGGKKYAEYSTFSVGSSADKYRLSVSGYHGEGDSFSYHNGSRFSTKDSDNDNDVSNSCAIWRRSGWWHDHCTTANLNGLYYERNYASKCPSCANEGITWGAWHGYSYSLKVTEMKISPVI